MIDCSPYRVETPACLSISGGRTSGLMLHNIMAAYGGRIPGDIIPVFANTGKEREETLVFVRDMAERWGVRIRWIEYARTPSPVVSHRTGRALIGCHGIREVAFETASRRGEPYTQLIDVKAEFRRQAKDADPILPNPVQRWCSGELKARPIQRLMEALGFHQHSVAVGLRADEPSRVAALRAVATRDRSYEFPLSRAGVTERDVLRFWEAQPFDLALPNDPTLGTYAGNCDLCFLKKRAKIDRLIAENPQSAEWWIEQERRTGQRFRKDRPSYEVMSRLSLPTCDDVDLGTCLCTD